MDTEYQRGIPKSQAQSGVLPPAQASVAAGFQPTATAASQHLSEAVLRRYGVVPAAAEGLEPVHLQPPVGPMLLHITRRYALHLAPHIRLAFVQGAASPSGDAAPAAADRTLDLRRPAGSQERQAEHRVWIETLVERLFARGERQSSIPAAEPAPSRTAARAPGAADAPTAAAGRLPELSDQPLRMVLRKLASTPDPSNPQTPKEGQTDAVQVNGAQWARPALPSNLTPAPIDIQQITQQVIQTIDRKIIGQRERFGRI